LRSSPRWESAVQTKIGRDIDLALAAPLGCGIQTGAGTVLHCFEPKAGQSILIMGTGNGWPRGCDGCQAGRVRTDYRRGPIRQPACPGRRAWRHARRQLRGVRQSAGADHSFLLRGWILRWIPAPTSVCARPL
jgi:hypothetical protein